MLERDLAELYGVTTGNLNKAVKRNIKRFPEDFMFQLSEEGAQNLIFQFGTSSWSGIRKPPFAFTEQGIAMLSGVDKNIVLSFDYIDRLPEKREESPNLPDRYQIGYEIGGKKNVPNLWGKDFLSALPTTGLIPEDYFYSSVGIDPLGFYG